MAGVLIKSIADELRKRLKASVAAYQLSLEEEARALLRITVARRDFPPRENLVALARFLFGPEHGANLEIPLRASAPRRGVPDFSGQEFEPSKRS